MKKKQNVFKNRDTKLQYILVLKYILYIYIYTHIYIHIRISAVQGRLVKMNPISDPSSDQVNNKSWYVRRYWLYY